MRRVVVVGCRVGGELRCRAVVIWRRQRARSDIVVGERLGLLNASVRNEVGF